MRKKLTYSIACSQATIEKLPLWQRVSAIREQDKHLEHLIKQSKRLNPATLSTVSKLKEPLEERSSQLELELELELELVTLEQGQALEQHNTLLEAMQLNLDNRTSRLTEVCRGARDACQAELHAVYSSPVSHLSIEQAHTLCFAVAGVDLPLAVFHEEKLDGSSCFDGAHQKGTR